MTDNEGNPLTGDFSMTFAIYDAEVVGNPLWQEEPRDVTVNEGLFSVLLGEVNPIPLDVFDGDSAWMEVTVEGETMDKRKRMVSVGYAFRAEDAINDWGKPGVAEDLYEGETKLTDKYVNVEGDAMTGELHVDAKITTSGNIGIGTTSPGAKLELAGLGSNDGLYFNGNTKVKITTTADTGTDSLWFAGQQARNAALYILPGADNKFSGLQLSSGPSRTTEAYLVHHGSELMTSLQLLGATHDRFAIMNNSGTEIFQVTSGGNVGIGTTPYSWVKLGVQGGAVMLINEATHSTLSIRNFNSVGWKNNIQFVAARGSIESPIALQNNDIFGFLDFRGYDGSEYPEVAFITAEVDGDTGIGDLPSRLLFLTTPDGTSTSIERMRIDNAGNVGIGTMLPSYKLHISGGATTKEIMADVSTTFPKIWFGVHGGGYTDPFIGYDYAGNERLVLNSRYSLSHIEFQVNGFEQMRINGSGVGIGTTSPGAKLHIGGTPDVDGIMFPDGTLQTTAATGDITSVYPEENGGLAGGGEEGDVTLWVADLGITENKIDDNAVTTAKIAPQIVSSIDGVSNDGGDIDLDAGPGITITSDDGANKITISASGTDLPDGSVTTEKLADEAVTTIKIEDGAVTPDKLSFTPGDVTGVDDGIGISVSNSGGPVPTVNIANGGVGNAQLANNAVTSNKIQDGTITTSDLNFTPLTNPFNGSLTVNGPGGSVNAITGNTNGDYSGVAGKNSGTGPGVYGESYATRSEVGAVTGKARQDGGSGVYGETWSLGKIGGSSCAVYGRAPATGAAVGGAALAVLGRVDSYKTEGSEASLPCGVFGWATATSGISAGVLGQAHSSTGPSPGVYGVNVATSGSTRGVWGEVKSSNGVGVFGINESSSPGTKGGSFQNAAGTYAHIAHWDGSTHYGIKSNGIKSTVVPTSNGHRVLVCPESPEAWFEDFGEGQLVNGRAHIELDPLFLETVTINSQHPMKVFVQLNDDCNGVFVKRGNTGFDVIELQKGQSNAHFTYRVVAKRKGFEDKRLELSEAD